MLFARIKAAATWPLAVAAVAASAAAALGQELPLIEIDTGGHTATIRSVLFTPDGKQLVSGGYDKAVRVWDPARLTTERTIRGQISPGREGEIYALALSPDGKTLAAAGYMSPDCPADRCGAIRLFDFASGSLRAVLAGHQNVVLGLAFTPDGSRLVSASADRTIRVWDPARGVAVHSIAAREARASRIAAMADGRHVATTSDTAAVDIYDIAEGRHARRLDSAESLHSVAASTDGKWLAAGSATGALHLWSWPSGARRKVVPGDGGRISVLAFARIEGGRQRLAAVSSVAPYKVRLWNPATMRLAGEYAAHDNTITAIAVSPDGRHIATAGGSDWSVRIADVASGPKVIRTLVGGGRIVYAVGFLEEAPAKGEPVTRIGWGYADPCPGVASCPEKDGALEFTMGLPGKGSAQIIRPEPLPASAARPMAAYRAIRATGSAKLERGAEAGGERFPELWLKGAGERRLSRRGRDLGEDHTAFTFDPAGARVASSGRNGVIEIFGLDGGAPLALHGHSADVWSIAFDKSGRRLVSGSGDQTVRLWNADTGELIASLLHFQDGEWVAWTPRGYYAASPQGEKAIGWHLNRGPAAAAEFVRAAQLRTYFYQPALVERAIQLGSAREAEDEARRSGLIQEFRPADIGRKRALPSLSVLAPKQNATVRSGRASVVLRKLPDDNVEEYIVYVKDTRVDIKPVPGTSAPDTLNFQVPLYRGKNTIRVVARSKDNLFTEQTLEILQEGDGLLDKRETLYILAIGVDRYPNMNWCSGPGGSCDLTFAGADARAVEAALRRALGPSHQKVVSRVLHNGAGGQNEPTRANIEDALQLFDRGNENDTLVLFVAGHGDNRDQRNYLFLPSDALFDTSGFRASSVLHWSVFERALHGGKGRRILFVDTCRSANAYGSRIINDSNHSQVVVYTATRQQQDALEKPELAHGVFTFAAVEGLGGKGDTNRDGLVKAQELGQFIKDRVGQLTQGDQEPDYYKPLHVDDFVWVRVQ